MWFCLVFVAFCFMFWCLDYLVVGLVFVAVFLCGRVLRIGGVVLFATLVQLRFGVVFMIDFGVWV